MSKLQLAAALAAAAAFAGQAFAADLPSTKEPVLAPIAAPPVWQYQVSGYGFLSSIGGELGIGRLPNADVDVPFGKVLDHLRGVFAGNAVARSDQFYLSIDGMWVKVGASTTASFRPGSPLGGIQASFTEQLGIVTAYAGYRLPIGSPDFSLYATVGGRYQGISASLNLTQAALGFNRYNSQGVDWVDPLVGLAMHYRINDKWFMDGTGDIGGFDVGSKLTSQEQLTIGYNWTQSISTSVGYRVLYTDYVKGNSNGGSFRYNTTLYGPYVGVSYNF